MLADHNINPPENDCKVVRKCYLCENDMYEGEEVHKIGGEYYCDYCVEHKTLECEEPDWDSMPGGYDSDI